METTLATLVCAGVVAFGAGFVTVAAAVPLLRARLVDVPNERSSHAVPTPRGGGIGIVVGVAAGIALAVARDELPAGGAMVGIVAAALVLGAVGFVDDVRSLSARLRLAVQLAVSFGAVAMLVAGAELSAAAAVGLVVVGGVWVVAFVNGFNFMDGINGISGVQSAVTGVAWIFVGDRAGLDALTLAGVVLLGASLACLPHNFPRARVFLGDVGSYFVGAFVALVVVFAVRESVPLEAVAAPLVIYVGDVGFTLLKRAARRERIFEAHRSHVYQRLCIAGLGHTRTTLSVGALAALTAALGAVSLGDSTGARVAADIAALVVVLVYLALPEVAQRRAAAPVRSAGT